MPNPIVSTPDKLMYAFNFNEADMRANRRGKLTTRQKRNLQQNQQVASFTFLITLIVGVGVGMWLVIEALRLRRSDGVQSLLTIVMFFTSFVLVAFTVLWRWQAYAADDVARRARSTSGRAIIRAEGGDRSRVLYSLYIRDQRFALSLDERDVVFHGKRYRVFYLPHTQSILSIESLPEHSSFRVHRYTKRQRPLARTRRYTWQYRQPWAAN